MVCENTKNYLEAAQLYERTGLAEKAASIYIQLKLFSQAMPLISKIKSPKLLVQLAKAKETEANFKEAENAYEKAEDWENVIRINLNYLNSLEKAKDICRDHCPTQTCAKMISDYCDKKGLKSESIEFLIMGGAFDDAFNIAVSNGEMKSYTEHLKEITPDEALRIAQYYEGKNEFGEAAKYFELAGNSVKALKLFIQTGTDYVDYAIELVARIKTDQLIHLLLDFLTGESDGVPKDPKLTYKLFMALGDLNKASKIAITIANEEQERGNYKPAHQILYETQKDIKDKQLPVPWDLHQRLLVIHSYIIVKRLVKCGDHDTASRMLSRVCNNISQFPAHDATILTSAVLEAMRAGMKITAYKWAITLRG
mmetsp:Transcript_11592/g.10109  ORF Transcript_11592/g.10109 Transcript_11592/m.10109 type:complete len:368 (-) Transcript_11592:489-1592(-)